MHKLIVNYEFYEFVYHGTKISPDDWSGYETRAHSKLDQFKRMYQVSSYNDPGQSNHFDPVYDEDLGGYLVGNHVVSEADMAGYTTDEAAAVCAMADVFAEYDAGQLSAVSIGSVHESYAAEGWTDRRLEKALFRAASVYLRIYRGVG